jgi:glycosyltransferase involved in cell wall biosynthesis
MKKSLMIVYAYYPEDERLRRQAEALINSGYNVSILCLKHPSEPKSEIVSGVNVIRLDMTSSRSNKSKYILLYLTFFVRAFFKTVILFFKNKYDVVHIHNMPDFLVFLALVPKIFGTKVILDLHDPSPEIFMAKFSARENSRMIKLLKWVEKISIRFAHSVITTNKAFVDVFVARGCPADKINIVMNTPQESIFSKSIEKKREKFDPEKFIVMYHGTIVERHGLDILARAAKILENKIPELEVHVFGAGEFVENFLEEVERLEMKNKIKFHGRVSLDEIAETIPEINVGVIPNRINPFTQLNLPIRTFEYLFYKKAVIVPRTRGIMDYFNEESIFYFDAGKEADLAEVLMKAYSNPVKTSEVINKGYEVFQKYRWENQSKELLRVYASLLK